MGVQRRVSLAKPRRQAELGDLVWGEDVAGQLVRETGIRTEEAFLTALPQEAVEFQREALHTLLDVPKDPHSARVDLHRENPGRQKKSKSYAVATLGGKKWNLISFKLEFLTSLCRICLFCSTK